MGNISILKPILLVFLLFLLPHISIGNSTPSYIPVDNIVLNCGSAGNTTDMDKRMWIGDMDRSKFAPIEEHNQKSATSEAQSPDSSLETVPYMTARLSYSQFTYVFPVTSGPKFVRLYFYADSYSGYDGSLAFFTVEANSKFTLLRNFSASILANYLGGSKRLSKEFCINVEEDQKLNLTFIPTPSTASSRFFAFINGIEIVSMPTYLYYSSPENPSPPYVGQNVPFSIDNSRALEMILRLNMGGDWISPKNDTGMFRKWSQGSPYLLINATNPREPNLMLKYSAIPNYTAPDDVYRSAITMGPSITWNSHSNLTWGLPVDPGFNYLVRLHFCEIEPTITMAGERPFIIYIDNKTAEGTADVIMWSGGRDTPVYQDYVVMIQKTGVDQDKSTLFIALHPGKATNAIYDAILNGVEVFKLSDNNNNLAGPNHAGTLLPSPPSAQQPASTSNSRKTRFIAIGTGVGLFLALLTLACCVVVWKLRTSKRYSSYYPASKCWFWSDRNKGKSTRTKASSLPDELCRQFSLEEIKTATHDFDEGLVIGVGGFGKVYKGFVDDGPMTVAIKRLNPESKQGAKEFWKEIEMLSQLRHVHLVSLIGYCNDEREMILVYDYMSNGTLREHLYDTDKDSLPWIQRLEICIGAARGLNYLHTGVHKHLNNPFPSTPTGLPSIRGTLFFNSKRVPSRQIFSIGEDFQILWSSNHGGYISIYHQSSPSRSIWSTIPGQAFVSAALAETEVEESRGSFVVKDGDVHLVCNDQTIEDIRVIDKFDRSLEGKYQDSPSGYPWFEQKKGMNGTKFPILLITGSIFSMKKNKRQFWKDGTAAEIQFEDKEPSTSARYWVLFEQKNSNQIGFQVMLGQSNFKLYPKPSSTVSGRYRRFRRRLGLIKKRMLGFCWYISRPRGYVIVSSAEEEIEELRVSESAQFNRVCLTYSSEANERFYGFGEQFSHVNFKGKRVPIFVQEQGIGRGDQPITFAANLVSYRAGGDYSTTYAPSPFYMTSKMRSLYLEGYDYSVFDLTRHDRVQIQIHGSSVQGRILHGNSPSELIEHFTETIGRPPELPEWIISGAVVGIQGGTETVRHTWDGLRTYNVPISAFWLQDWVGQRETLIGSQLWWNWEVDTERYWGWQQLVQDLSVQHIKVMTYCNPCLAPIHEKPNRRRNLFEEAKSLDILVKDKQGQPYMVPNTAFDVGMLDLTHPNTASWFKQILQEMVDDGVRGWMADFGEGLPVDATLYSGEDPISAHNRYPELWAQINSEFVEEWKRNRAGKVKEDPKEALVFFMRAGFRNSPKWGMLFWEGDQMVSWQANDGIKSAVTGLLSSGLSGYAFNHSDIGGYCAVNLPFIRYRRSEELLLRWMELNAFTTVFRTHEGNKPSCNSQFYSNHHTLSQFARFAQVYRAWKFYRIQLVKEAAQKGLPVCRHLFLHYPEDDHVHSLIYQQFLVGTEILVVPVLDKGKKNVKVYFPVGERCDWQHIWTGKLFREQGCEASVEAPIGYPAVFVKTGSTIGETFIKNLRDFNIV